VGKLGKVYEIPTIDSIRHQNGKGVLVPILTINFFCARLSPTLCQHC
jgi:hypothetical protein